MSVKLIGRQGEFVLEAFEWRAISCLAVLFGWIGVSLLVFALAPFETWAWFANLATPIALAAMFGGERLLRYRLHPDFERSSVVDAIRAYRAAFASSPSSRGPRP